MEVEVVRRTGVEEMRKSAKVEQQFVRTVEEEARRSAVEEEVRRGVVEEVKSPGLEEVPLVALSSLLLHLDHPSILSLSSTSSSLRASVASLTQEEERVVWPCTSPPHLSRVLLGLRVEVQGGEVGSSAPPLEVLGRLVRSERYRVGRLVVVQGEGVRSVLGHHLTSHSLLQHLLHLHSSTGHLLSSLTWEVDLLCHHCRQNLGSLARTPHSSTTASSSSSTSSTSSTSASSTATTPTSSATSNPWAKEMSLTLFIVEPSSTSSTSLTTGLLVHTLLTLFKVPRLRRLAMVGLPPPVREELEEQWFRPDRSYFTRVGRTFQLLPSPNPHTLDIALGELVVEEEEEKPWVLY